MSFKARSHVVPPAEISVFIVLVPDLHPLPNLVEVPRNTTSEALGWSLSRAWERRPKLRDWLEQCLWYPSPLFIPLP